MVITKSGSLFDSKANMICHQVNCRGVMGAGIAKQIRERHPQHYEDYIYHCNAFKEGQAWTKITDEMMDMDWRSNAWKDASQKAKPQSPLGQYVATPRGTGEPGEYKWVCGIFGQDRYGNDGKQYTDYEAVRKAFTRHYNHIMPAIKNKSYEHFTLAVPYGFGCGLGGGNWDVICDILDDIFGESEDITMEIWKLN